MGTWKSSNVTVSLFVKSKKKKINQQVIQAHIGQIHFKMN